MNIFFRHFIILLSAINILNSTFSLGFALASSFAASKDDQNWLRDIDKTELLEDIPQPHPKTTKSKAILSELIDIEEQTLRRYIGGQKNQRKYTTTELDAMKIQVSDILKSNTFIGLIPKKTQLILLHDNSLHYTTRDITVRAYRQKDFENCILLQNKDGSISYKVAINDIKPIDDMLRLHEAPKFFKPEEKSKSELKFYDGSIQWQSEFNFHFGINTANFSRDLLNESQFTGLSNRYELVNYAHWDFPIKLGLALGIQQDSANLSDGGIFKDTTFYFAPAIKTKAFDLGLKNLFATAMLKSSLLSSMTVSRAQESRNYAFYKMAFTLGIQKEKKWTLGSFIYGFDIQRQWARVTGDNIALSLSDNSITDDSITFKIGFGRDW